MHETDRLHIFGESLDIPRQNESRGRASSLQKVQHVQHSCFPTFCVAALLIALASASTESCRPVSCLGDVIHIQVNPVDFGGCIVLHGLVEVLTYAAHICPYRKKRSACEKECCVAARMKHRAAITDLSPEVFTLIVDRLLPVSEDGSRTEALDFACLRLSSRGFCRLCDAAVRRLDLRHCSSEEMQTLLRRFSGAAFSSCDLCLSRLIENALMLHVQMMRSPVCNMGHTQLPHCKQLSTIDGTKSTALLLFAYDFRHGSACAAAVLRLGGPAAITAAAAHRPAQPAATVRILLANHRSIRRPDTGKRGYDGNLHWLPLPLCGHPAPEHKCAALNVAMAGDWVPMVRRWHV
jgi:hypothetical protein